MNIFAKINEDVDSLRKTKGGIGMRGPGETQIETDRGLSKIKSLFSKEDSKD